MRFYSLVAPTQPDVGYDDRTRWLEGQNEARLQAYAQQQAARQAVPLQASQPPNPYGWLARLGNLFIPPAHASLMPPMPLPSARVSSSSPKLPLTGDQLSTFRQLAEQLKQQETLHRQNPSKGLDSVEALQLMIEHATKITGNNPEAFLRLMNEVLLGKETNSTTRILPHRQTSRIMFGDLGMNSLYKDHSEMQMYHFWAYVNYGYYYPKDISKGINYGHDVLEPQIARTIDYFNLRFPLSEKLSRTGSKEDYRLSGVGYNLGQALAKGHVTPKQLAKMIDRMLRTDDYRPFPDEKIPKEL